MLPDSMNKTDQGEWIALGQAEDITEGKGKSFVLPPEWGGQNIAVFLHQGEYYALDDCCSHAQIPLVDGLVKDDCIMCPWHYAEFDLKTGAALSGPATEAVATYPVRLAGNGMVEIKLRD